MARFRDGVIGWSRLSNVHVPIPTVADIFQSGLKWWSQTLGAMKVIILKIALLVFRCGPFLLQPCAGRSKPGIRLLSQPLECFFPGRISHFAWRSNMTLVTGNNTQEALLSRSLRESDQEIRDDGVDLEFQSKFLYPVVTGCK